MSPLFSGRCHCGALGYDLDSSPARDAVVARICSCTFCLRHRPRWWSDPEGTVSLRIDSPNQLIRYRFGHATADFLICSRCGVVAAAVTEFQQGFRAVCNLNLALDAGVVLPERALQALDEDREQRLCRRGANWTPILVGWPLKP